MAISGQPGLTAQKPSFDGCTHPISHCYAAFVNQRCPLFLVRLFLSNRPRTQ